MSYKNEISALHISSTVSRKNIHKQQEGFCIKGITKIIGKVLRDIFMSSVFEPKYPKDLGVYIMEIQDFSDFFFALMS